MLAPPFKLLGGGLAPPGPPLPTPMHLSEYSMQALTVNATIPVSIDGKYHLSRNN